MNRLLETGDRDIESTIAPGFTEHVPDGQADRTLLEMIEWLLVIRATWPELRISVVSLDQHDQMIVARLKVNPGKPQALPGLPLLAAVKPVLVTEYLQIDRTGVTDRWSARMDLPVASLVLQSAFSWVSPGLSLPAIVRMTLDPGRTIAIPIAGPAMLRVESGSVQLSRAGTDLDGLEHSSADPVRDGEVRVLDTTDGVIARNISGETAELWVFASNVQPDLLVTEPLPLPSKDARISCFIPLRSSDLPGTTHQFSITRISLPPGTAIAPHTSGGMEAVAVVDGEIEVTVEGGRAVRCAGSDSALPFDELATIGSDAGVSSKGATSIGYRVTGMHPATVIVMRITSSLGQPHDP